MNKFIFQMALMSLIGTPYKFGGSNPVEGFDCSGLAQEALKMCGVRIPTDMTAQGLFNYFSQAGTGQPGVKDICSLSFYGQPGKITHVGILVDGDFMIEARGGDASVVDASTAAKKNAFVSLRHYKHRQDFVGLIRPIGLPF